eukprot:3027794-Amphidinium_carterae.1
MQDQRPVPTPGYSEKGRGARGAYRRSCSRPTRTGIVIAWRKRMEVCRVDSALALNCLSLNTCSRFKCCAFEEPFRQKMATEGRWLPVHVLTVQGQQQELVLKANVFPDE